MRLQTTLILAFSAFLLSACSAKKNVYDEIFSNQHQFTPINTKEIKEIK